MEIGACEASTDGTEDSSDSSPLRCVVPLHPVTASATGPLCRPHHVPSTQTSWCATKYVLREKEGSVMRISALWQPHVGGGPLWGEPEGGAGRDVEQQVCGRRGLQGLRRSVVCCAEGRLGSNAGALVCLKRSGCSMWANLQVPVLPFVSTSTKLPIPSPCPTPCRIRCHWYFVPVLHRVMLTAS